MPSLQVERLGWALGARVTGVDLREHLDDETIRGIRNAWLEHIVLCFPEQNLEPEQHVAFCRRFGETDEGRPASKIVSHPDVPAITVLTNLPVAVNGKQITPQKADKWHSDLALYERTAMASFLCAKELPDVGGDTLFANMYVAYETLSPAFRRLVESLEGIQDQYHGSNPKSVTVERRTSPVAQPMVQVHAETGRKALYLGGGYMRRFVGLTDEESAPLVDFLIRHATRHEFVYRHRWTPHDLLMWDNRCASHNALLNYDQRQIRRMQRCSVLRSEKSGRECVDLA